MILSGHNRNIIGLGLGIPRHEIRVEDEPISSIKTTAEFYNEIRLETGYSDGQNVNPLTNFADSTKPNATQATPSKQGEFVANDINGYPSILVDGVDDFYDLGDTYEDVLSKNVISICFVAKFENESRLMAVQDKNPGEGSDNFFQLEVQGVSNKRIRILYGAGGVGIVYDMTSEELLDGQYNIYSCHLDFQNDIIQNRVNGVEVNSRYEIFANEIADVDPSLYVNHIKPVVGGRNTPEGVTNFFAGKITAFHINNDSLADLQTQETKLNEKYAIY